ncbi:hypothetical protein ANN_00912 [Periplaneta americana]|uniref:Uncharacterized protein n=1 Tax=Periplaneta americana TaxID=6978 RepID=A0ABQ8TTW6_PERAM|nr:hypothetical protein ANN_00912 [Periplaneta americana]
MAGLCEGGNEPSGSLKAICKSRYRRFRDLPKRHPSKEATARSVIVIVPCTSSLRFVQLLQPDDPYRRIPEPHLSRSPDRLLRYMNCEANEGEMSPRFSFKCLREDLGKISNQVVAVKGDIKTAL